MTTPFILTYNIRRSVFQQLGLSLFKHLNQVTLHNNARLHLLPVVNNLEDNIETRAHTLTKLLRTYMDSHHIKRFHLISYSLSGIDARYAISKLGMNKPLKSLTTIATPHQGCRLAQLAERKVFSDKQVEPISRLLGVGLRPFYEINKESMKYFNQRVKNMQNVNYFSIGAERLPNNMTLQLRDIGNALRLQTQKNFIYENDGVVGHDECIWGEHLVNFEADHTQIIGINPFPQLQNVFTLIEDNASFGKTAAEIAKY